MMRLRHSEIYKHTPSLTQALTSSRHIRIFITAYEIQPSHVINRLFIIITHYYNKMSLNESNFPPSFSVDYLRDGIFSLWVRYISMIHKFIFVTDSRISIFFEISISQMFICPDYAARTNEILYYRNDFYDFLFGVMQAKACVIPV